MSKHFMYTFYSNKLKGYGPRLSLNYMDIDSFFLQTFLDPIMIMKNNMDEFDTSKFPKDHKCYWEILK